MPQAVDDLQRRAGNDLRCVLGVHQGSEPVRAPVQNDDRARDGPDVERPPSWAVRDAIVGYAGGAVREPFPCPTLPDRDHIWLC